MAYDGIREKTTNVGGIIKRIWYAMTGATQGTELMSIGEDGFSCSGKISNTIHNEDTVEVALALRSYGLAPGQTGNGTAITLGIGGNYNITRVGSQIHTIKTNYDLDAKLVFSNRANGELFESGGFFGQGYFYAKSLAGVGNRAVYSDANGNLTNTSSDVRVKKNIENITDNMNVLDALKNIRGVTYNWDTEKEGYKGAGEQQEIGVIAQEIEQYIPQVVGENSTGYKSVDYAKLTAYLIEVNKALLEKVEILESKVV